MKIISLIILLFYSISNAMAQGRLAEVFTLHEDGQPISLYYDIEFKNKVIDIHPNKMESNAGEIIYIDNEFANALCVQIVPIGEMYAKKGDVAVNTRNYDGPFFLYKEPNYESEIIGESSKQQTTPVYGVYNYESGITDESLKKKITSVYWLHSIWLYVHAVNDSGEKIEGWLPPEMQCPNPYTTCC